MTEVDARFVAQSIFDLRGASQLGQRNSSVNSLNNNNHSINLITEDFLSGYSQDGRMSVIRRFFCFLVTFDLFFTGLQWLICILITGDNIYNALKVQILQYSITKSIFDIVITAFCRFMVLLFFYGIFCIDHLIIIALSTSISCSFLIVKVFFYDWAGAPQPVFHVVLILTSFILACGEGWFYDCVVRPKERYARNYYNAVMSNRSSITNQNLPYGSRNTENLSHFYSPYESLHNSEDEEDAQNDYYREVGMKGVRKAYELLQSSDWKVEKTTKANDKIRSKSIEDLGKIYRLSAYIKYPPKKLLHELFYKIEDVPRWNPTLIESKIIKKIDTHTDITYQASAAGGGGTIKCRDFVNLRCWRLCRNGVIVEESEMEDSDNDIPINRDFVRPTLTKASTSEALHNILDEPKVHIINTLSTSLNARNFSTPYEMNSPPPIDDDLNSKSSVDSKTSSIENETLNKINGNVYISAAVSIQYSSVPLDTKYIRGQNIISCWAIHEVEGNPNDCIFEWLLCLDLKGYVPRFILDNAYSTLMQDYMKYLRAHLEKLKV